jgi:hypothetical protein
MKVNLVNLKIILLQFFAVLMVWYLADNQIVEMNTKAGFNELIFNLDLFYSLFFIIPLFLIFFKCNQNSPQYILIGILLFYSYVWFFFFYNIFGYLETRLIFWGGFLFLLPVVLLFLTEKYLKISCRYVIFVNGLIKLRVEFVLMVILVITLICMFIKTESDFSYIDSYDRRILAREEVTGLLGYFFQMSANTLAPILAFLAIYNRNYKYLFPAFVFGIMAFGFTGIKAPLIFTVLMSLSGYFFLKRLKNIIYFLVLVMTTVIFFALLEFLLFDFSWIADIFIRRINLSPPLTMMKYLDFVFAQSNNDYSFLIGNQNAKEITYLIGEIYSKNILKNENTISFLTVLGQQGILGYFFNIVFLIFFYSFLQYLYKVSKHKVWIAVAIIYGFLLLEQSYTVAFLSSGIGLITILLLIFSYKKNKNIYD